MMKCIMWTQKKGGEGTYFSQMNPKWKNIDPKKGMLDALDILEKYSKCEKVYTSRLHCYLPCLAMGVPVEFRSPEADGKKSWGSPNRFQGLDELNNNREEFEKIRNNLKDSVSDGISKSL